MGVSPVGIGSAGDVRFQATTTGKKVVMAVSGLTLAGFVVGHLLGNLQVFLGPEVFNAYARSLRALPALVWSVRLLLLIMVTLHIWTAVQLALIKRDARPIGYVKRTTTDSTYASRTMYWSGPIIAVFVVYHLMQFTLGVGGTPFDSIDAYGNLVAGFRVIPIAIFYIFAMALLCLHLRHGLWSMFQSIGLHHPRYTPRLQSASWVAALLIFLGFSSIPAAVMAGLIPRGL
jgi:succinate dehydrogenase cytochrome b subunit